MKIIRTQVTKAKSEEVCIACGMTRYWAQWFCNLHNGMPSMTKGKYHFKVELEKYVLRKASV